MKRRDLLKLTAAGSASPLIALETVAQQPNWKPKLFDAHQNETVIALSELIIPATDTPGAKAALVNRWMDQLLVEGLPTQRNAFLAGLSWMDGYSIRKFSKPFVKLSSADQTKLLEAFDLGTEPGIDSGRQFFRMAKGFVVRVYYQTEIGFSELNKGGRVPQSFGCRDGLHG